MKKDIFQSAGTLIKGNEWLDGLFGLEKENIRVDMHGVLSQTLHPQAFGNKLRHPYITTDFSESQVEMITPPLPDIRQAVGFLETIHDIVSLELNNEYLWPQSLPPVLPDNAEIPLAKFDEDGKDAQEYRQFLAQKYGAKNQLFSGIHFNFSFGENLLKQLYRKTLSTLSYDEFKDEVYLKTMRQILRMRWLYILLYGNSPVVDSTMELKCKRPPFTIDSNVIALSIRNSCYGYQNIGELYPDYSSVTNFRNSIDEMVKEGKLMAPRELYSSVRPKFIQSPNHISYLEFRFIDIDPTIKAGITEESLYFLHTLALYGLLTEEPDLFDAKAQSLANNYHGYVSLHGLSDGPFYHENCGGYINTWEMAEKKLQNMAELFRTLGIVKKEYVETLKSSAVLVKAPKQRKVYKTLEGILKMGYIPFHLEKARQYLVESQSKSYSFFGLEDMELSTQLMLRESVKRGVKFEILDRKENFIKFSRNGNVQYVKQATKTSLDNYVNILAMENKLVTKKILEEHDIRVPHGYEYTSAEIAKSNFYLFEEKAIVIKPNQTNFGIGITIIKNNTDENFFNRAVDIAFENDSTILIEEFIEGKEFRFFVISNEVVGILHRIPANVTGDGVKTIRELVNQKNQDPMRGKGYRTPLEKIRLEEAEAMFLKLQNKDFESIPVEDEIVYLRENSNISTGGDSIDVTDEIPFSYKKIAVDAAKALNVQITGLDMIIPDITREATDSNYAIIEMNFNPAIHIHCHPYKGKNRKLNEKLMDALMF